MRVAPAAGFVSVVLIHPSLSHLAKPFTYRVPDGMDAPVGSLVRVPVRGRNRLGIVVGTMDAPDVARTVPIAGRLGPGLPEEIVELATWTAGRYLSTRGEALASAMPERVASEEQAPPSPAAVPSPDPLDAMAVLENGDAFIRALNGGRGGFVWRPPAEASRGDAIAAMCATVMARGAGAIVLVPEVRVDAEVVARLRARFGDALAWLGSDVSARARYRAWLGLRAGALRLAVGGRGAIFAPVRDLGLIVVDDEGHAAYKEGRAPRFHARAVAVERASRAGATFVLVGSPPSMEAHAAVHTGAATLVAPSRARERASRPPVMVVDRGSDDDRRTPSGRTLTLARRAHDDGRRVVILSHRGEGAAIADRIVRALRPSAPAILNARSGADALRAAVAEADLIIATPYIAKDLDVAGAGLLAIVDADAALSQPEFRAAEETFATWWHASRWAVSGTVVIETADPRQAAIVALTRWDPDVLWRAEAARRRELGYPPFAAIARVDVPPARAAEVAREIASDGRLEVLGPVERDGRTVVVARARRRDDLLAALAPMAERWREADEPMRIDVDPREVLVPKWRS